MAQGSISLQTFTSRSGPASVTLRRMPLPCLTSPLASQLATNGWFPPPLMQLTPLPQNHSRDVAAYITKELNEGAMLGPFDCPPPSSPPGYRQGPYSLGLRRTLTLDGSSWTWPGLYPLGSASTAAPLEILSWEKQRRCTYHQVVVSVT